MKNKIKELKDKITKKTKYQELLGFKETDSKIYDVAFMHSSMDTKDKNGIAKNNQRLEFLGDAVLESVISDLLYIKYPEKDEGYLSQTRSTLVCRKTTNEIGQKLGLKEYMQTRKTVNEINVNGNALEALIGAIYLDKGYEVAKKYIRKIYEKHTNLKKLIDKDQNYKSLIQDWAQKNKQKISYKLLEETHLPGNKVRFQSQIIISGKPMGQGVGNTKKESEKAAAKQALQTVNKQNKNTK